MTAEQQQQLIAFFTELQFFDNAVWRAIVQMEPMTQEMFDYIQLRRMEVGPKLEDIAEAVFRAYPEFAMNYADRMEKTVCSQKSSMVRVRKLMIVMKEFVGRSTPHLDMISVF